MGEGMGWRGKAQFICKQKPTDLDIVKKKIDLMECLEVIR